MTSAAQQLKQTLSSGVGQAIYGLEPTIHGLTIALIAKGQVLLEGVPGLGKTLLAKTLAHLLGGTFKRVQCTADMMPSDLTGIHVYNAEKQSFDLIPGPLFADVVLVDEINRTGPKTQSAFLQAMEEGAITIDRETYPLARDFFIIASQNPHEFEGTFPLPESQLDRFLLRLQLEYPDAACEASILKAYDHPGGGHVQPSVTETLSNELIDQARTQAAAIHVSDAVYDYTTQIAAATRSHHQISLGLSPRGALALMRCARVEAALRGAEYVTPDDIKAVADAVMAHRLILTPDAVLEGIRANELANSILDSVEVPRSESPSLDTAQAQ
ncbi:MAG TPA: MoxR family ATPase [Gammaproteobacteria bacterium]|nr:MoxR family ATPase [Gammaproteobacteria bacterium]